MKPLTTHDDARRWPLYIAILLYTLRYLRVWGGEGAHSFLAGHLFIVSRGECSGNGGDAGAAGGGAAGGDRNSTTAAHQGAGCRGALYKGASREQLASHSLSSAEQGRIVSVSAAVSVSC